MKGIGISSRFISIIKIFRVIETLAAMQNPEGGFGGGHGQISHCATSYAAILSLVMIGGDEALGMIDRRSLYVLLQDPCMENILD